MALVHGSAMSTRPPAADAATPLRSLAPETEAKLAARASAGLAAIGPDYPRRRVWQRVVVPSGLLAAADAAGIGVGAAHGQAVLAVIAAVLFVPFAAIAALGARFAAADPLRLTVGERRAVAAASHWQSRQDWTGPHAGTVERGLVVAATSAAERIARTAAWRSGYVDELRVHLDLAHELDQIDDQSHRIAAARTQYGGALPTATPALDTAWTTCVDRVAALTAYANQLDGYDQRRAEMLARQGDPVRDTGLLAGSVSDEMASQEMLALLFYLNANFQGGGP
jgi:hypothetical protein